MEDKRPKVGVGVVLVRGEKILLGERLSGHGAGMFQIPGGHLEFGETFEDAARREVAEETGLTDIEITSIVSLGNDIAYEKHYVSIGVLAQVRSGEPQDIEPEHSKNWQWYEKDGLPDPIFPHSRRVIDNWLNKKIYTQEI